MEFVEMVHAEVDGVARVPQSAIGQHALAGWRLKDEVDAEAAAAAEEPAEAPPAHGRGKKSAPSEEN